MVDNQNHFAKDVDKILQKINNITRNQIFIDIILLIQGINFVIHPQEAHKGIIESLAITVFITSLGIIIGMIISKKVKKDNLHTILVALAFVFLSIIVFLLAKYLAPTFQTGIAVLIIVVGIFNVLNIYHLSRLIHTKNMLKAKISTEEAKDNGIESISVVLRDSTRQELARILSPAVVLSDKVSKLRFGQVVLNLALIVMGIVMIFFRFHTNAILMRTSGGILIFSAIADIIAALWTHHESQFVETLTHPSSSSKTKHKK